VGHHLINIVMENTFCKHVNVPFELSLDSLNSIQARIPNRGWPMMLKFFESDPNLLNFLAQHNIGINHAEAFYTPPGQKLFIHIDGPEINNHWTKLNWVYGGEGSKMQWWSLKNPNKPPNVKSTPTGTPYMYFEPSDCDLVWSDSVGQPSLVNVGVPHSVDNTASSTGRWCLCYILEDLLSKRKLEWSEAADRLQAYLM
jgi:hypothetical protein